MRPFGPRTRANFPIRGIISGVARHLSKSTVPFITRCIKSSEPTMYAPASFASFESDPCAKTAILILVGSGLGSATEPRIGVADLSQRRRIARS